MPKAPSFSRGRQKAPTRGSGSRRAAEEEGRNDERKAAMQEVRDKQRKEKAMEDWVPKTELGKKVAAGEITSLDEIFDKGYHIFEPQIVDSLTSNMEEILAEFTKTTRMTRQGRNFLFRAAVLIGDKNGHVGIGIAKDRERYPAIKKATDQAKLNIIRVVRGSGSWEDTSTGTHSVPFKVEGKSSSVRVILLPAPKGIGLVVGNHIKDVLRLAGVQDVWSQTKGSTATKLNFVYAAVDALRQTTKMRMSEEVTTKMKTRGM